MKKDVYSFNTPSSHHHAQSEDFSSSGLMGRRALLKVAAGLGVAGVGAGTLLGGTSWMEEAFAASRLYNGNAAATWADKYAIASGTNYSKQTQGGDFDHSGGDDCTNFVSNCMFHGGLPMDKNWYSRLVTTVHHTVRGTLVTKQWEYGSANNHPWTVAQDLYNYLTTKVDTGAPVIFRGPQKSKKFTNGLVAGDVVFYSWHGDGKINHVAIMTSAGRNSKKQLFDRVDEHTSDRKQVFWTLEDFWTPSLVPNKAKVTMYCVHLNNNTALIPR